MIYEKDRAPNARAARAAARKAAAQSCCGGLLLAIGMAGCSQPLGLGSSGAPFGSNSTAAGLPGAVNSGLNAPHRTADGNPDVLTGLRVEPVGKWGVKVQPGSCSVGGKNVAVPSALVLTEEPVPDLNVKAEPAVLADEHSAEHGTALKGEVVEGVVAPGMLDATSVVVWSAAGEGRRQFRSGVDYVVEPRSGIIARKSGGAIAPGQTVYVDYRLHQRRVDAVVVNGDGTVALKRGEPAKTAAVLPNLETGTLALANIFLDYGARGVTGDAVFPIGAPYPEPSAAERQAMVTAVAKTRAKLQANGKVTVAFWGDGVTAGVSASETTKRFPDLIASALQTEFKGSQVKIINAGQPDATISDRLPALDKDVLSSHPDLVVVQFLSDGKLSASAARRDYTAAVEEMKKAGAEVILVTPNFTLPEWMGLRNLRGRDTRPNVQIIRSVAQAEHVGLADVSERWQHLAVEGIPYTTLLANGVSYPDDRGQQIYARSIQAFF